MTHEILVGLHVSDNDKYQEYRDAMMPILRKYGGGFRTDFIVSETLKPSDKKNVNRVFTIYFRDKQSVQEFFNDPEYVVVKKKFYEKSATETHMLASYNQSE